MGVPRLGDLEHLPQIKVFLEHLHIEILTVHSDRAVEYGTAMRVGIVEMEFRRYDQVESINERELQLMSDTESEEVDESQATDRLGSNAKRYARYVLVEFPRK
ncbi:hypothetical protein BSKO_02691 [Bryopsis sp. KO-2023]|nr:hypothetical protein BSKO_02691 [Bryopsis sp. KO-2023]